MTKPKKQTSSTISSIAGRYARMGNRQMFLLANSKRCTSTEAARELLAEGYNRETELFFRDIRKLAASCLSQDEVGPKTEGREYLPPEAMPIMSLSKSTKKTR